MREIALAFLKLGATAYGGPAMMGVMQAEFQERRQWLTKARFLEGMGLVSMLPGATATQLGIFLGYVRGGWWGGLLAGLCFAAPGFVVMLALAAAYATLGMSPIVRGALYGLGPVVLAIFVVAVYRLGLSALRGRAQLLIAVGAAVALLVTPLGAVAVLAAAGGAGLLIFHSRRSGVIALVTLAGVIAALRTIVWGTWAPRPASAEGAGLGAVVALFATIGAFTFGGGISMIALIEEHVVAQRQWLTPQEFLAGLALGQLTPGPVLMVAAYVGYKVLGVAGALAAAVAAFLPSFVLMLTVLPAFDRVRNLAWARALIQGIAPGVIGVMAVALVRLLPHAAPDPFAAVMLVATVFVLLAWRPAPVKVILGGAAVGVVRG